MDKNQFQILGVFAFVLGLWIMIAKPLLLFGIEFTSSNSFLAGLVLALLGVTFYASST